MVNSGSLSLTSLAGQCLWFCLSTLLLVWPFYVLSCGAVRTATPTTAVIISLGHQCSISGQISVHFHSFSSCHTASNDFSRLAWTLCWITFVRAVWVWWPLFSRMTRGQWCFFFFFFSFRQEKLSKKRFHFVPFVRCDLPTCSGGTVFNEPG